MLSLIAEPTPHKALFEAEFEPSRQFIHKGASAAPELRTFMGKKNRLIIGVPQTTNVLDNWPRKAKLDDEIAAMRRDSSFYCVRLALSFVPDKACRFIWVRLEARLVADAAKARDDVVAFDLFPLMVTKATKFSRSYGITPKVKLAFAEIGAEAKTTEEGIAYAPQMDAAGLLSSTPAWTFQSQDRSGLVGSRELFMIVKSRRGQSVRIHFGLGAAANSMLGPLPLREYGKPSLGERVYTLQSA